jgi:putative N6-adenine-specific DNA methylase
MELQLFAVCAPGLEPFTNHELRQLGLAILSGPDVRVSRQGRVHDVGGVEFKGALRDLYRANLHLRTASRVLVRFGAFYAAAFSELRKKASRLPWEKYLTPGQSVALRVTCHKSRLYHSDAVAERIAGAIEDRLGRPVQHIQGKPEADEATTAQLIIARLDHDHCQISLDSSGELLHRRGYRLATAKAPLRETLAAGLLMAAQWEATAPLLDPFCGSGTIAIEAALIQRGLPPGRARRFAFMEWPGYDAGLWRSLLDETRPTPPPASPLIFASDRDAGALEVAQANAARAGVANVVDFSRRAVSAIEPPATPGWVVTNPPYGARIGENRDLRNLYAQFGNVLRAKCAGWRVAFLTPEAQLARQAGFDFESGLKLVNGGRPVRLVIGSVPSNTRPG